MVSKKTREWAPLASFINIDRFLQDAGAIADAGRGRFLTKVQTALSLLRNYTPAKAPNGFRLADLLHEVRQAERRAAWRQARRPRQPGPQA